MAEDVSELTFETSNIMRKIGLFLIIVVILAVVQETEQQECSRQHCSGIGRFRRCGCGCHNCCVRKYGCVGGICRRFSPSKRKCYCYTCKFVGGYAKKRSDIDKDSKAG